MNTIITKNEKKITRACKKYKVKELYAFGSVVRDDFNKKSDVDLLYEFKKMPVLKYGDYYFAFHEVLEKIFNRKVDLLSRKAMRNKYLIRIIDSTKQKIYG